MRQIARQITSPDVTLFNFPLMQRMTVLELERAALRERLKNLPPKSERAIIINACLREKTQEQLRIAREMRE